MYSTDCQMDQPFGDEMSDRVTGDKGLPILKGSVLQPSAEDIPPRMEIQLVPEDVDSETQKESGGASFIRHNRT